MTNELEHLAALAVKLASPNAVIVNEFGFTLDNGGVSLDFFSPGSVTNEVYCRGCVGELGERPCPASFAEAALMGNFFWRATEGATLSLNETEHAIYLTDRFDAGAFADETALENYANDFLRTLRDWQGRLETSLETAEVRA